MINRWAMLEKSTTDYMIGKMDEIDERLAMISKRLDDHISACMTRYFMLVSGVIGTGTLFLVVFTLIAQHHG